MFMEKKDGFAVLEFISQDFFFEFCIYFFNWSFGLHIMKKSMKIRIVKEIVKVSRRYTIKLLSENDFIN